MAVNLIMFEERETLIFKSVAHRTGGPHLKFDITYLISLQSDP